MGKKNSKKEKLVVDSVDKALKSYMDDNISPENYKKLIFKLQGGLVKAVLREELTVQEYAKTDKLLGELENRKNNSNNNSEDDAKSDTDSDAENKSEQ
jgi:hypothetical protein